MSPQGCLSLESAQALFPQPTDLPVTVTKATFLRPKFDIPTGIDLGRKKDVEERKGRSRRQKGQVEVDSSFPQAGGRDICSGHGEGRILSLKRVHGWGLSAGEGAVKNRSRGRAVGSTSP